MTRDSENNDSRQDSISEMEQIQKGLEEFLQKELQHTESGSTQEKPEPQFFTIDKEEKQEREIDIIGSDYFEDWDSPDRRKKAAGKNTGSGKRQANNSGKRGSSTKQQGSAGEKNQRSGLERKRNSGGNKQSSHKRQESSPENKQIDDEKRMRKKTQQEKQRGGDNGRYDNNTKRRKKGARKKSGFKRFLITAAVILALFAAGLYYAVGVVYDKMKYEQVDSLVKAPMKEEGVVNILLIGNDSRENGEDGRSDAMILLSISSQTKKIYMTSLLRDMYVDIPGHEGNRLNAAYSFGGAELLMETIEHNFDIPLNRYILVNFEAFAKLVDAVGGVELELTGEEIEYVNAYLVEYNMLTDRPQGTDNMDTSVSGLVHLNGPQALAYSRNRYLGTDFGRTERQRKVLSAVIQKLPKALLTNPKELIDGLMPNLTTNLTQQECFRLSLMASKLLTYEIVQTSIPIEGTYQNATIRKMSVLEVDFEANKKYLQENIYGKAEN